jgi:hypothetical protein
VRWSRRHERGCGLISTPTTWCARAALLEAYGAGYNVVTQQQLLMPDCKYRRNEGCMAVITR